MISRLGAPKGWGVGPIAFAAFLLH